MLNLSLFFLLLIILIFKSINLDIENNKYIIKLIDNEMLSFNSLLPLNDLDGGYYYFIAGENSNKGYDSSYKRYIYKLDINSNIFINKYIYNSKYPFENAFSYFSPNNKYLLTTTQHSFEIYNWNNLNEINNDNNEIPIRSILIEINSYYYYAYVAQDIDKNYALNIDKIQLLENNNEENPIYQVIKKSEPIKITSLSITFSCDVTQNKENIICSYHSKDLYFSISVYDLNLNIIYTDKRELINGFSFDSFIKVLYFKNDNKFIIINSKNDYMMRLRYLKYINNIFINQLSFIVESNEQYLDILNTQHEASFHNNDALIINSNKFVKIFTADNKITISIFQFYDYDTLLFIRIYNLENYDTINYSSNINPYLSMIQNSLMISLSAKYEQSQTVGFFFLNYPNAKNITLTGNKIKVNELISKENIIYDLNIKLKVLDFSENFIFIDSTNSNSTKSIKKGDILEINSEIELIQYKINEGIYYLKYIGIMQGNDNGFDYYKIYPLNKNIPEPEDIYIEGKEGYLAIDINDCFDGYYKLEDDLNLCTSINPKGYYFDKKYKIYKKCSSPCLECSDNYISYNDMNCISCINNYTITEDTNSCYDYIPINYFKDNNNNILRRCHPLCTKCFNVSHNDSEMNCLQCEYGYFLKEDTHNCLNPDDYKKREKKDLSRVNSGYLIIFIVILIFSLLTTIGISLSCLFKDKTDKNIINEENKNDEENQIIKNKSIGSDDNNNIIENDNNEILEPIN